MQLAQVILIAFVAAVLFGLLGIGVSTPAAILLAIAAGCAVFLICNEIAQGAKAVADSAAKAAHRQALQGRTSNAGRPNSPA